MTFDPGALKTEKKQPETCALLEEAEYHDGLKTTFYTCIHARFNTYDRPCWRCPFYRDLSAKGGA